MTRENVRRQHHVTMPWNICGKFYELVSELTNDEIVIAAGSNEWGADLDIWVAPDKYNDFVDVVESLSRQGAFLIY